MSSIFWQFRNMKDREAPRPLLLINVVQTMADAGRCVRQMRKQQGLRIDDAAALCGVSADLLSRLENGAGSVRLDKLLHVLQGLGLQLVIAPSSAGLLVGQAGHAEPNEAAP
jgi:transcriptional regulator with XRE-family HTH domain